MLILFSVRSLLCEAIADDDEILFDILISCGARPDAMFNIDNPKYEQGSMTLMHFVVTLDKLNWVEKLMLLDVSIDGIDANGRTPLYMCKKREEYDTLVSLGANEEFISETLEHFALHSLHLRVPA